MALIERYFSTTSAGAGDGTSWADRAALLSGGAFSTIITGFAFNGSDGLRVRIGPGTYNVTTQITTASFANPPTIANPIIWHGCDSSGVLLSPPDPDWKSNQPIWDDSSLPVIATTTLLAITGNSSNGWFARLIKFSATARNGAILSSFTAVDWCSGINSTSQTSAGGFSSTVRLTNSVVQMTGTIYQYVITGALTYVGNCRLVGAVGASGNRDAVSQAHTTVANVIEGCTIVGVGGRGWFNGSGNVGVSTSFKSNHFINCGGTAIELPSTASQTGYMVIRNNYISGSGGYGINAQSASYVISSGNRLRDNALGNFNGFGNYPTDNYTTDSDDATEFTNVATGDYRIKYDAAIVGQGYGVSDASPTDAEIAAAVWSYSNRTVTS